MSALFCFQAAFVSVKGSQSQEMQTVPDIRATGCPLALSFKGVVELKGLLCQFFSGHSGNSPV